MDFVLWQLKLVLETLLLGYPLLSLGLGALFFLVLGIICERYGPTGTKQALLFLSIWIAWVILVLVLIIWWADQSI